MATMATIRFNPGTGTVPEPAGEDARASAFTKTNPVQRRRNARPGRAPVWRSRSSTIWPFTMTQTMPSL